MFGRGSRSAPARRARQGERRPARCPSDASLGEGRRSAGQRPRAPRRRLDLAGSDVAPISRTSRGLRPSRRVRPRARPADVTSRDTRALACLAGDPRPLPSAPRDRSAASSAAPMPSAIPVRACQAAVIARVEPLTTTRRLSGPFDYQADRRGKGSIVRIPFGHQKLDGVVVGSPRRPTSPRRSSSRRPPCATTRSRATSSTSRSGWPRSTARRPRGRSRSSRRRPGKAKTYLWAEPTGADGRAHRQASARCSSGCPGPTGKRPAGAAAARGARPGDDHRRASRAARRARTPRRTAPSSSPPPRRTRWRRSRPRPARRTCCTA